MKCTLKHTQTKCEKENNIPRYEKNCWLIQVHCIKTLQKVKTNKEKIKQQKPKPVKLSIDEWTIIEEPYNDYLQYPGLLLIHTRPISNVYIVLTLGYTINNKILCLIQH